VAEMKPRNLPELKAAILRVLDEIDIVLCRKRTLEVIERKGWHVDY
jgi:hypothetical protein